MSDAGKVTNLHGLVAALHTASVALAAGIAGDSDDARSDGKDEGECTNEHDDGEALEDGGCEDERTTETLCDLRDKTWRAGTVLYAQRAVVRFGDRRPPQRRRFASVSFFECVLDGGGSRRVRL